MSDDSWTQYENWYYSLLRAFRLCCYILISYSKKSLYLDCILYVDTILCEGRRSRHRLNNSAFAASLSAKCRGINVWFGLCLRGPLPLSQAFQTPLVVKAKVAYLAQVLSISRSRIAGFPFAAAPKPIFWEFSQNCCGFVCLFEFRGISSFYCLGDQTL